VNPSQFFPSGKNVRGAFYRCWQTRRECKPAENSNNLSIKKCKALSYIKPRPNNSSRQIPSDKKADTKPYRHANDASQDNQLERATETPRFAFEQQKNSYLAGDAVNPLAGFFSTVHIEP